MTHGSLFSGIGGFDLAAEWAGFENKFHCEWNPFCRQVLNYHFPESESYDDITKQDFSKWRDRITVLSGGFPCQPFSVAGRRKGKTDERYLWPEMLRAIREIRPVWVIGENVAGIASMVQPGAVIGVESKPSLFEESDTTEIIEQEFVIETICQDLEQQGYSVQPILIPACAVGAPHRRDRVWFIATRLIAHPIGERHRGRCLQPETDFSKERPMDKYEKWHRDCVWRETEGCGAITPNTNRIGFPRREHENRPEQADGKHSEGRNTRLFTNSKPGNDWKEFPTQPPVYAGDDGISRYLAGQPVSSSKWREESVKACGNAIVPQVAYEIFKSIIEISEDLY